MPRKRSGRGRSVGEVVQAGQPKRSRQSRVEQQVDRQEPDVVQLGQPNPNLGSEPALGQSGNESNDTQGPTQSPPQNKSQIIDFERIFRESGIASNLERPNTDQLLVSHSDTTNTLPVNGNVLPERSVGFNFSEEALRLGSEDLSCHVPHQIFKKI